MYVLEFFRLYPNIFPHLCILFVLFYFIYYFILGGFENFIK